MRVRNCIVLYIIVWRSSYNAGVRIHVLSKTFPQLLELPVHACTHNERVACLHLGLHVYILCAVHVHMHINLCVSLYSLLGYITQLIQRTYLPFQVAMTYGAVSDTTVSALGGKDDLDASIRSTASRTKDKRSKNAARCVGDRTKAVQA